MSFFVSGKWFQICEEQSIAIGDIAANNLTIVTKAGHHEIYLMDPNGGRVRRVTRDGGNTSPDWSQ